MANLIDNALKYSEKMSSIHVKVDRIDGMVSIKVENLPGSVGRPDPEQVFRKYYRSPRAQPISGTGLGLYLAYRLAQSLGGELEYSPSVLHVGFRLCLTL